MNLLAAEYFFSVGVICRDEQNDDVILDRRYDLFHLRVEEQEDAFGIAALEGVLQEYPLEP